MGDVHITHEQSMNHAHLPGYMHARKVCLDVMQSHPLHMQEHMFWSIPYRHHHRICQDDWELDWDCYHAQKAEFIQKVSIEAPQKRHLFLQLHVFRVEASYMCCGLIENKANLHRPAR